MNSNGVITAPVSINADVYPVLGIASHNGWYDVGYACSNQHGKINMWSRYKPVRWNNKPNITASNAQWWKGEDGRCGIKLPTGIATYKNIPANMTEDKMNGWQYLAPTGGSQFYSLDFFENYKHDAMPAIYNFNVPKTVSKDGELIATCAMGIAEAPDPDGNKTGPGSIALDDIRGETLHGEDPSNLGEYYLGVVILDSSGNIKGRVVGGQTDNMMTKYKVSGLNEGDWYKAYPFLAKYQMAQNDTDIENNYITIPNTSFAEFKVGTPEEADGIQISFTAKYVYLNNTTKTAITYSLQLTSTTGGHSLYTNHIQMRFTTSSTSDALKAGEKDITLDEPISFDVSNPYTKFGRFEINSAYADRNYYLYLTLQTAKYTRKIFPMDQILPEPDVPASVIWNTQSGTWNQSSNSSATDGKQFTCQTPSSSGSAVLRCTFSGVTSITFKCRYQGESNYDYLTVGSIDTACTRDSYGTSLKGTSGTWKEITYSCDTGQHYVEFCYSKDSSVDESPDNAEVYVLSYS